MKTNVKAYEKNQKNFFFVVGTIMETYKEAYTCTRREGRQTAA